MQIQNEPLSYRDFKNFKFGTKNVIFGYFRHMLMLTLQKQLSFIKSTPPNLSKYKVAFKTQKFLDLGLGFGLQL